MTKATFTRDEVEAALCIWEELNDRTRTDRASMYPDLVAYREGVGSCSLRMDCVDLAPWSENVYEEIGEGVRDSFSYDWEIIPEILNAVTFCNGIEKPDPVEAARIVTEALEARAPLYGRRAD